MKLIVGLGNPGPEYENTRHNIGFYVVKNLQEQFKFEPFVKDKKLKAEISIGDYEGERILLLRPQTFMNLSGDSVQQTINYYKIPPEDCFVICDDLDTPFASIRLKPFGGPGTHNGMKSITNHIGEKFPRLRIGIESRGDLSPAQIDTSSFVLSTFTKEEQEILPKVIEQAVKATLTFLDEGIDVAMNKFNN